MARTRRNERYLPGSRDPGRGDGERRSSPRRRAMLVLAATPVAGLREVHASTKRRSARLAVQRLRAGHRLVAAPDRRAVVPARCGALSGPSSPTKSRAACLARSRSRARDAAFAREAAAHVHGGRLRVYYSARSGRRRDRRRGEERDGDRRRHLRRPRPRLNARAALITRGLAEITRLGVALGAATETFMGLTGAGDLILTATGDLSRNRRVGLSSRGRAAAENPRATRARGRGRALRARGGEARRAARRRHAGDRRGQRRARRAISSRRRQSNNFSRAIRSTSANAAIPDDEYLQVWGLAGRVADGCLLAERRDEALTEEAQP